MKRGRCLVMGILNATPDSFSDGGGLHDPGQRRRRIEAMIGAGADILDVGGESTRPGHAVVPVEEEIRRVVPVIEAIRAMDAQIPVSIDTSKAPVAAAALDAGATFVNDVRALKDPALAALVAERGCDVVLMRDDDCHGDIVAACREQLAAAVKRAHAAGVDDGRIILDPGLGFGARPGASPEDNLRLVDGVSEYAMGHPVLIGASRKRFVGALADEADPKRRLRGSIAVAVQAAAAGAAIVRVHDVGPTVEALAAAGHGFSVSQT